MPISQNSSPRVAFYNVMLQTMEEEPLIDRFLAVQTLLSSAKQTMSGLAVHIIRESFLKPDFSQQDGTVLRGEERLGIGAASFWIMVAGIVKIVILTSCVMYTTSQHLVARDPELLSTDATILALDPDPRKVWAPCSAMRTSTLPIRFTALSLARYGATIPSRSLSLVIHQVEFFTSPDLILQSKHGDRLLRSTGSHAQLLSLHLLLLSGSKS